jgi:hypothetical protein
MVMLIKDTLSSGQEASNLGLFKLETRHFATPPYNQMLVLNTYFP